MAESAAAPSEGLLPPVLNPITKINKSLRELPPPVQKVAIAVYGYTDQTGQFKPVDNVQTLSRAVTQGATSVLIKALQDAGEGAWFTVVERERLDNLMKERKIIADMRERYLGERGVNPKALPPLLFAGVLLEGGIVGYDSNTRTGGAGARYLGIGGDVKFREDTVTVYLRAISTKTGEVLVSTVAHKTVISVGISGGAFKFVALDRILEAEAGITNNEPEQIAVQQAIEKATHAMIVEGAARNLWAFSDEAFQSHAIEKFYQEQQTLGPVAARQGTPAGANGATAVAAASGGAQNPAQASSTPWQASTSTAAAPVTSGVASPVSGASGPAAAPASNSGAQKAAEVPAARPVAKPVAKRTPIAASKPPVNQPVAMLTEDDRPGMSSGAASNISGRARLLAPPAGAGIEPDFQPSPDKMGAPLPEAP